MFMCLKGRKGDGARVRRKERQNEGDPMSAHKNSFNLKSRELRGVTLEKVAEVERAVREKA